MVNAGGVLLAFAEGRKFTCDDFGNRSAGISGQHVVLLDDRQGWVAHQRIGHRVPLRRLDVLRPLLVIGDRVDADAEDLAVALGELVVQAGHRAQFGGAHRGEILRVRTEDGPAVADPLMEVDGALGGLGGEVWCGAIDSE